MLLPGLGEESCTFLLLSSLSWLHWVFVATRGLLTVGHRLPPSDSAAAAHRGTSRGGFSRGRARALDRGLSSCGADLVALRQAGSSQTRDRTPRPCIDRWIPQPLEHLTSPLKLQQGGHGAWDAAWTPENHPAPTHPAALRRYMARRGGDNLKASGIHAHPPT